MRRIKDIQTLSQNEIDLKRDMFEFLPLIVLISAFLIGVSL
jgi:hypothetical protein